MTPRSRPSLALFGIFSVLLPLIVLGGVTVAALWPGEIQVLAGARNHAPAEGVTSVLANPCTVTSTADSGPGTFRTCLENAVDGDQIDFDPAVFPPGSPVSITLASALPSLIIDNLTIDASNAGVILDGGQVGTTPEVALLDDVSLTIDSGPNLITNGDFTSGSGHWRPWNDGPGVVRRITSSDFHSSPNSYEWSVIAHSGDPRTVYDVTDTSDSIDEYPLPLSSTVWISATGGSTVETSFWFRYGSIGVDLWILHTDGNQERVGDWWYTEADWTPAVFHTILPDSAMAVALVFNHAHSQRQARGLEIISTGNTIHGLQVINFPGTGIGLSGNNNFIGGNRYVGSGPMGQGNLVSGNGQWGVVLEGASENTLSGNNVGTNLSGTAAFGNAWMGVTLNQGAHHNLVGGASEGEGNLISGNGTDGVWILDSGTDYNTISGNLIGTDIDGMAAIPNGGFGIFVRGGAQYNTIGGDKPQERNLISGNNGSGAVIMGVDTDHNVISGNLIGTDASGTEAMPNVGDGVSLWWNASWNTVGISNTIAFNAGSGIRVDGGGALYNTITQNSIHSNTAQGIALSDGGNGSLSAPSVTASDPGSGTASGTALPGCTIEVFSDAGDEGRWFEGETVTDGSGQWAFDKGSAFAGSYVQATCTDTSGNTSEFSSGIPDTCPVVSSSADSGPGTLRQCLTLAENDDTITFDTAIFPPGSPVSITLESGLPAITQGNLTIDGSAAGVILDGSGLTDGEGFYVTSNGNVIKGLQILNFPDVGVQIVSGASHNLIGGVNATPGVGCSGECNLISGNGNAGVCIADSNTMSNTISGNYIGLDATGSVALPNGADGIIIEGGASHNLIGGDTLGERNIITYNYGNGVSVSGSGTDGNRIEGNWIGVDADGTRKVAVSLVIYSPDYATDQTIFLGTEGQGVWKSTDGGAHWAEMNSDLTDLNVTAMAVSPDYAVDGILFAGTDSGVFKSTDGGTNWMDVSPASGGDSILSVALSPDYGSDQTVLLGNRGDAQVGGLWKSTDAGATWQSVAPASESQQEGKQADAVDRWAPGTDPWLDGMQWEPGLWDGEQAQVSALQDGGLVAGKAVAFSPDYATDRTMFVGGYDSGYNDLFFKSEDGGGIWARIDSELSDTGVNTIAVSPDYGNDETLFVIRDGFYALPFRSTDGGATWTQLTNGLPDDHSWAHGLALSPGFAADGTLFVPYGWGHMGVRGLFRSNDRGDTWVQTDPGVQRQYGLGMVAVSPEFTADGELLLAIDQNGLLRSTDRGDTWTYANGDLTDPGNDGHGVGIYDWASGNIVGGGTAAQFNLISNNGFDGVVLEGEGTSQNVISGNYIGANVNGTSGLGNRLNGVEFGGGTYDNRIGGYNTAINGTCSGECNLISGNGADGIIINSGSDDNTISGNYIGMSANGTTPIGNGYYGINVYSGFNLVGGENATPGGPCSGACNLISGNHYGLQIVGYSAISNTVTGNYVGTDVNGTTAIPSLGWDHSNNLQIDGAHNRVGGATPAERNVIVGAIDIAPPYMEPTHNQFIGNYLGVDATGTTCIANGHLGISVWGSDHVIGGDTPTEGNWICGYDGGGISVNGTDNRIAHNKIFDTPEEGIRIGSSGNLVAHNEIYGNSTEGVRIEGETALTNTLTQNSIYDNGLLGIDLVDGGNTELWAPVVMAYDVAGGTASGTACPLCTVEVFSDDDDEGRWFVTYTVAGPDGAWSIDVGGTLTGTYVHATATDADGNTSEFSRPKHDIAVVGAAPSGEVPVGQASGVYAQVLNEGSQPETNVPVRCAIRDAGYEEIRTSGEIQPATWALVEFPAWTPSAAGVYTLTCQSMLPGDENPDNDVYTQILTVTLEGLPDVWTRDNDEDTGNVPSNHPWWVSPDIWVRHQDDGGLVHQNPIAFESNTVYVQLRNRGNRATSGKVQVFWDRSRIGWPCIVGQPNVGTIPFEDLAPGEVRIVSLQWEPQEVGHHGLHTVIQAEGDPADWSAPCSPHLPRWDNNVSWHNVVVYMHPLPGVQHVQSLEEAVVDLVNVYDWPKDADLIVERGTFPATGAITLRLDEELFDRWWGYEGRWTEDVDVDAATKVVTVTGAVSATIGGLPLEPREQVTTTLTFDAPGEGAFEVRINERIDGLVVGGISYQWIDADETPPAVEATSPLSEAVEVALDAPIVVTFTEQIGPLSLELALESNPGDRYLTWNKSGTVVTATYSRFEPATTYTATVRASDAFANAMEEPYTWTFTVKDRYQIYLPLVLRNH